MSPSRMPSRDLGLVSSRKTSWKSKPGFMCRSQKPAVRVVDAKACFSFWFFICFVFRLQTSDFRDIYLNRIAEKVNQYLSGCVPVDEKYGT